MISMSPDSDSLILRHRAVNLFLQGYEKSWIEAEEHYFEDKLIEDLAVCIAAIAHNHSEPVFIIWYALSDDIAA